jgi:glycosyltransferase involved in cell wall biosynthesis
MADPEITVLVPAYNHGRYVGAALESVLAQTIIDDCRIVVSDDASSDDTAERAAAAIGGRANVTLRRNPQNLGVVPHYTRLVAEVTTPYLAILEADDVWISNRKLERQREALRLHPDAAMCFCACVVFDETSGGRWLRPPWRTERNRVLGVLDLLDENPVVTFSNCFYRTAILRAALAAPDGGQGYDWLCNLRISAAQPVHFLAEPCTLYRMHRRGAWSMLADGARREACVRTLAAFRDGAPPHLHAFIDDAMESLP